MRTTIDLDDGVLKAAKGEAHVAGRTLSQLVNEAVRMYLAALAPRRDEPPFELLVRGRAGGRFPSPAEIAELEALEDLGARPPRRGRRAAS